MQRLRRGRLVLNHGDADVVRAGIAAVGLFAREITAGHDAHAGLLPQPLGHDLAAAVFRHVEPKKKSAGRTLVAVAVADDLIGEIELGRIELAVFPHMRLIAIGGDGDMLRRARHLRRRDIAQLEKGRQKAAVAGGEADAQAGQVRALGQRVENHGVGEIGSGGFQHAGGLMLAVDLAIAFVGEHQKAEAAGKRDELVEIGAGRDGALWVRRRGEVEGDGARQQCVVERVEIGQEGARPRRRHIDRLAVGGERAGGIGGIERIGDQHRRLAGTRFDPALGSDGGEEQSLARAVEHQHFAFGIDRPR